MKKKIDEECIVNIVRGAWGWVDWASPKAHGGVPGLPRDRGSHVDESTNSASGALLVGSRGVCGISDVSGELPEALWRRFGSSWGALGALFGSIFD